MKKKKIQILVRRIPNFKVRIFEKYATEKKIKTVLKSPGPGLSNAGMEWFWIWLPKLLKGRRPRTIFFMGVMALMELLLTKRTFIFFAAFLREGRKKQ